MPITNQQQLLEPHEVKNSGGAGRQDSPVAAASCVLDAMLLHLLLEPGVGVNRKSVIVPQNAEQSAVCTGTASPGDGHTPPAAETANR